MSNRSLKMGTWLFAGFAALLTVAAQNLRAEVVNVDAAAVKELVLQGVPVVDLRTAGEWKETGVIDRSHLITLFDERGRAKPDEWLAAVDKVAGTGQPVILICRTGNRTRAAARYMDQLTPRRKIYNVTDGITGWIRQGKPVVSQQDNLKHAGISCGPVC